MTVIAYRISVICSVRPTTLHSGVPKLSVQLPCSHSADKHLGGAVGWRGEESNHYSLEEHASAAYYWLTNLSPSSDTVQDAHVHVHLRQLLPFDVSMFYR